MPTPGSTDHRGYGYPHQKERRRWKPTVDAGRAYCNASICLEQSRWIKPGTPWDLGHDKNRTRWTGPEHRACNRSDGGRRSPYGHRYHPRHGPRKPWVSRKW